MPRSSSCRGNYARPRHRWIAWTYRYDANPGLQAIGFLLRALLYTSDRRSRTFLARFSTATLRPVRLRPTNVSASITIRSSPSLTLSVSSSCDPPTPQEGTNPTALFSLRTARSAALNLSSYSSPRMTVVCSVPMPRTPNLGHLGGLLIQ